MSKPAKDEGSNVSPAAKELQSYISRAENLLEDRKAVGEDLKVVFAEAKAKGYDPKIMKMVIKRRAMDRSVLEEQDAMLANYETNLDSVME